MYNSHLFFLLFFLVLIVFHYIICYFIRWAFGLLIQFAAVTVNAAISTLVNVFQYTYVIISIGYTPSNKDGKVGTQG